MTPKASKAVQEIINAIDDAVQRLSDAEYVDVLDDISSHCDLRKQAKTEESEDE